MKRPKTVKMTPKQKLESRQGSRFIRVIPSTKYAEYLAIPYDQRYKYDLQGRRIA